MTRLYHFACISMEKPLCSPYFIRARWWKLASFWWHEPSPHLAFSPPLPFPPSLTMHPFRSHLPRWLPPCLQPFTQLCCLMSGSIGILSWLNINFWQGSPSLLPSSHLAFPPNDLTLINWLSYLLKGWELWAVHVLCLGFSPFKIYRT